MSNSSARRSNVMPSITICTFLTLTNSFKMYDVNVALTNGGPVGIFMKKPVQCVKEFALEKIRLLDAEGTNND